MFQGTRSTQKQSLCFYTPAVNNSKINLRKQFYFQKMKHLEINLTKKEKDFYAENYKTLLKEVKDDVNKWKNPLKSHVNGLEDLILLRCLYYPK